MVFPGLRPEPLEDYKGTDGLRLSDIKDLDISNEIQLDKAPAMIVVENKLSKAMHQYFPLIGEEGATYIKEYLKERRKQGEEFSCESHCCNLILSVVSYKQEKIDRIPFLDIDNWDFQKPIMDKVAGAMAGNRSKQRIIPSNKI